MFFLRYEKGSGLFAGKDGVRDGWMDGEMERGRRRFIN